MDLINEILKWTLFWLLIWQAYILFFNKGVPNIKTAPACRRKIAERLKKDIEEKGQANYTILDLGSGNGRLSRHIARALPQTNVIGYEISKLALKHSNILKNLFKAQNLEYKEGDFFEEDLSHADAIVFFLSAYEMGKLGKKLHENAKPGTLIISNRFALHDWKPVEILEAKTIIPKQGKIHVYRKK